MRVLQLEAGLQNGLQLIAGARHSVPLRVEGDRAGDPLQLSGTDRVAQLFGIDQQRPVVLRLRDRRHSVDAFINLLDEFMERTERIPDFDPEPSKSITVG